MSDSSLYRSSSPETPQPFQTRAPSRTTKQPQRLVLPKDDFGLAQMMAIIELKDMPPKQSSLPPLDPVDQLLFGRQIDLNTLHPHIRDIYSSTFKQLDEMDDVSVFAIFEVALVADSFARSLWMNFYNTLLTHFDLLVV